MRLLFAIIAAWFSLGVGAVAQPVCPFTPSSTAANTQCANTDFVQKVLASRPLGTQVANASVTGTTLNKLAKLTGAPSTAVITATTDTSGILGVVTAGAGTSGNATVALSGQASCVFDGATTAGDYVQNSSTAAGDCHDAGASLPSSGQVLGLVLSTNGAGGTYAMLLFSSAPSSSIAIVAGSGISVSGTCNSSSGINCTIAATILRSYLAGLQLSNDGVSPNTVLDISAGMAADSTNTVYISLGAFTKSTGGAWAAGSGSNGMGNGLTIANTTWYHVFAIINNGAADVYFDTSVTAANKPANTTSFRRIGSFLTDASAHIIAFSQNGDEFLWNTPILDVNVTNLNTAVSETLTVPTGVEVWAKLRAAVSNASANTAVLLSALDVPDSAPSITAAPLADYDNAVAASVAGAFHALDIRTNTSAQIRAEASAASTTLRIATYGWIDHRGRDN